MSIAPLKKITLIAPLGQKSVLVAQLQQFGRLHLNNLNTGEVFRQNDAASKTLSAAHQLGERLKQALQYLQGAQQRQFQVSIASTQEGNLQLTAVVEAILQNQQLRRSLADQRDALLEREEALQSWGDFQFPEGDSIAGYKLWFYILPGKYRSRLDALLCPWQIVHQDHRHCWLVLIAKDEPAADILPCERVHTGRISLSAVRQQRQNLEIQIEDLEAERQKWTRYLHALKRLQAQAEDISALAKAERWTADLGKLMVMEGWLAEADWTAMQAFAQAQGIVVYAEAVAADDAPPTLLQNAAFFRAGEWLVNFYQTPAYRSWDPAVPLFISFALFFAMILADAGYAAVMLLVVLLCWRKLAATTTGRLLRPLCLSVTGLSVVWGGLVGSYFGRSPSPESLLAPLKIFDLNDFNGMMSLSIGCGIIHLMVANGQQAWLARGQRRSYFHLGWLLLLALAPALVFIDATQALLRWLLYGGIAVALSLIFINASARPITSVGAFALRFLEGLKALTDITNLFGDVLSYLRLFALGLASSSLALTFNHLADQAFAAEHGFALISGVFILIVGHALNVLLGLVSGVVHGLRLNFIEFYKWALYGEGYPFRAFKKREYTE